MFTLIPGLPPFTVGILAQGKITKEDFDGVMEPALQKATAEWKGVNLLLVMDADFKDFTPGAWVEDFRLNAVYFLKWNKVAIVSNKESVELITAAFKLVVPGEAKMYNMHQLDEAKAWVAEP